MDDYLDRFSKNGKQLGLTLGRVIEIDERRVHGMAQEAALLRKSLSLSGALWCLDERGETLSSVDFADRLAEQRDLGQGDLALVIGGADGIDPSLRAEANTLISFGKMVWPHMLARAMLAEQLYRASTILSGGPYHRV